MDLALLSLFVHVPIVTVWIGLVMLDLFASAVPGMATAQRGRVIAWSRPIVILSVVIIVTTGTIQTIINPFQDVNGWTTLERLRETPYGTALFFKHGFVLLTFAITMWVRFPLASRLMAERVTTNGVAVTASGLTRQALGLSIINLLACLGTLLFTTRMLWELH